MELQADVVLLRELVGSEPHQTRASKECLEMSQPQDVSLYGKTMGGCTELHQPMKWLLGEFRPIQQLGAVREALKEAFGEAAAEGGHRAQGKPRCTARTPAALWVLGSA